MTDVKSTPVDVPNLFEKVEELHGQVEKLKSALEGLIGRIILDNVVDKNGRKFTDSNPVKVARKLLRELMPDGENWLECSSPAVTGFSKTDEVLYLFRTGHANGSDEFYFVCWVDAYGNQEAAVMTLEDVEVKYGLTVLNEDIA